MEEVEHLISVLEQTRQAIIDNDSLKLRDLSNQTVHSASTVQDPGSIALAVIVYTLGKFIERGDNTKIKQWSKFIKKVDGYLALAITSLKEQNTTAYESYLERIRQTIPTVSPNLKSYIQEVLRKAMINKASRIYEHGISMGQTAKLLGISQWELSEYAGQKEQGNIQYDNPESVKERAALALEFFS